MYHFFLHFGEFSVADNSALGSERSGEQRERDERGRGPPSPNAPFPYSFLLLLSPFFPFPFPHPSYFPILVPEWKEKEKKS